MLTKLISPNIWGVLDLYCKYKLLIVKLVSKSVNLVICVFWFSIVSLYIKKVQLVLSKILLLFTSLIILLYLSCIIGI